MYKRQVSLTPELSTAIAPLLQSGGNNVIVPSSSDSGALREVIDALSKVHQAPVSYTHLAMGKTAFVLSMAKNIAINFQQPVGIFSLEMSNVQLVNRLIVNVCQIKGESCLLYTSRCV